MKIIINNYRKIFAVQQEFTAVFPDLKINFFAKPNTQGGAPVKKIVKNSKTIGDCRTIHNSGFITILPEMSVGELKQHFSDVYGLSIELFVKSGDNNWKESDQNENTLLGEVNDTATYMMQPERMNVKT